MAKQAQEGELSIRELKRMIGAKGDLFPADGKPLKGVEIVEVKKAEVVRIRTADGAMGVLELPEIKEFQQYGRKLTIKPAEPQDNKTGQEGA